MNDEKNGFPSDDQPNGEANTPKPIQIRCKECGFLFDQPDTENESSQGMAVREITQCPSCTATLWTDAIWASAYEVYTPSTQRKKYEIVCCPNCGRHNKNVTEDSIKCELCGKILDTATHCLEASRPNKAALRISLYILLTGWTVSSFVAWVSGKGFLPSVAITIWIAILPLLIHFLQRTSRP